MDAAERERAAQEVLLGDRQPLAVIDPVQDLANDQPERERRQQRRLANGARTTSS
jgi:hypothetical protein